MITSFVGTIKEQADNPVSGCGKTAAMTSFGYFDHIYKKKRVWSNYYTVFSERVCGFQEMIDEIGTEPQPDLVILITEMKRLLNSLGSKQKQVHYIENFTSQLRKLQVDLSWDDQRYNSVHLRLRTLTDVILMPKKYHEDNSPCNYNLCQKPHIIRVYSYKPYYEKARLILDMNEVAKLYNSNEFCEDELILSKGD